MKNLCLTCPNNPWCLVFEKYKEVYTPTECIDLTNKLKGLGYIDGKFRNNREDED